MYDTTASCLSALPANFLCPLSNASSENCSEPWLFLLGCTRAAVLTFLLWQLILLLGT